VSHVRARGSRCCDVHTWLLLLASPAWPPGAQLQLQDTLKPFELTASVHIHYVAEPACLWTPRTPFSGCSNHESHCHGLHGVRQLTNVWYALQGYVC
jgi:hypothetical protein